MEHLSAFCSLALLVYGKGIGRSVSHPLRGLLLWVLVMSKLAPNYGDSCVLDQVVWTSPCFAEGSLGTRLRRLRSSGISKKCSQEF